MTPQEREVMQMALGVLELVDDYVRGKHEAKEALYETLAQPEQGPVADVRLYEYSGIAKKGVFLEAVLREGAKVSEGDKLYTAPPQQPKPPCKTGSQCVGGKCERCAVQEPWGYISHRSWKMPVFVEADDLEVSGLPFNNPDYTPVYKAPPQREWHGLTDEERDEICLGDEAIARDIEAKLKEKNT